MWIQKYDWKHFDQWMGISDFPSEAMKKLTHHNAVRNMSITEDMKQDRL